MWKSSLELLATIHDAHERLKSKETDATTAHAEARLLTAATRVMAVSLEHARLTGRLVEGSEMLPPMGLGTGKPALAEAAPIDVKGGVVKEMRPPAARKRKPRRAAAR